MQYRQQLLSLLRKRLTAAELEHFLLLIHGSNKEDLPICEHTYNGMRQKVRRLFGSAKPSLKEDKARQLLDAAMTREERDIPIYIPSYLFKDDVELHFDEPHAQLLKIKGIDTMQELHGKNPDYLSRNGFKKNLIKKILNKK